MTAKRPSSVPSKAGEHAFHLGNAALDLEHQGQLDLLLEIERELRGSAEKKKLADLLDRLIDFTNLHFMSEQVLMRQQAYPGLPDHMAEHDDLMEQMRDFQARVLTGNLTLSSTDLATLHDWVLRHICTQDAAFAEYMARQQAETAEISPPQTG